MKHFPKKKIAVILAFAVAMTMTSATSAFALGEDDYLVLGADLDESQKATVLDLLDVDDVSDYQVLYVTNEEEHQYLDSYVSSDQIGTQSLSSVVIKKTLGSSIDVETHNIGYCTEDMYRNALATAGLSGADVTVAGPFMISGTAALVGTIKAYSQMTGEEVSDEVIESSVDEITTTGEVGEEIGDTDAAEGIVATVKEEMADNPDMTEEEIEQSIQNAADSYGVSIPDSAIDKTSDMLQGMQEAGVDWDNIKDQSSDILKDLGNVVENVDADQALSFFDKIKNWIQSIIG